MPKRTARRWVSGVLKGFSRATQPSMAGVMIPLNAACCPSVLTPLRRVGAKGTGEFAPISWDEAIDEIARRWRGILDADGAEAILPFSYAGSMGQVQFYAGHPLFHALGT